jgi:chromosome segregation ATPase
MNIQDIADFIDLVKNPVKYENALKRLQEENERLHKAIETVGKASELDNLRKDVEKERAQFEQSYKDKVEQAQKQLEQESLIFRSRQEQLVKAQSVADAAISDAHIKMKEAQALADSFAGRDKELRLKEQAAAANQEKLQALMKEYDEKVTKLRSVMA